MAGEYAQYMQQVEEGSEEQTSAVFSTIDIDVARSFNTLPDITPDVLKRILKTYAIVLDDFDYCQGMNYIAGFLYLTLNRQEGFAFAVMREVIEKYNMSELFNSEAPMIKLIFYQMDRLIAVILPDLHQHFKAEGISSSFFSSPFFVTIFTSTL